MKTIKQKFVLCYFVFIAALSVASQKLVLNEKGYFEMPGLNVIVLEDVYPEGHQGGITIIQHGKRIAANGNLSLQPTPGQWQPYPELMQKEVDEESGTIVATLKFPDSTRIKTANQPIIYPDLEFSYQLRVIADGDAFRIVVDLDKPLPAAWVNKVGFNLDLYPALIFGKTYFLGDQSGVFPV